MKITQIVHNRRLHSVLLLVLIAFFSYTMINKALDITSFQFNIAKTGLFNGIMVDMVAYGAIAAELISIILLIVNEKLGLLLSLLMMFAFTSYITFLFITNRYEICGCGGILNGLSFSSHFFINILLLLVISFLGYGLKKK